MERGIRPLLRGAVLLKTEHLLAAAAILLEALRVYPLLLYVSSWEGTTWRHPPLGLGSTLLVLTFAYLSARHVATRWPGWPVRLAALAGTIALAGLLLRLEQGGDHALLDHTWGAFAREHLQKLGAGALFGVYLIWRGLAVGREELTFDRFYRPFVVSFLALGALMVIWSAGARSGSFAPMGVSVGLYIATFFFAGLFALALSNFQAIQEEARRLGSAAETVSRRWIAVALGVTLSFVLAALGLASVVSLDFVTYVRNPLSTLGNWLLLAFLYGIALPLSYVAAGVTYVVRWLVSLLQPDQPPPQLNAPSAQGFRRLADAEEGTRIPPELITAAKWGLLALVITILLFLLLRAFVSHRATQRETGVEEVSESLWSWQAFQTDLRSFLKNLFGFLKRPDRRTEKVPVHVAGTSLDEETVLGIRDIYRGLLWESERAGRPRRQGETPLEFAARLDGPIPGASAEIHGITQEYVLARYGHQAVPQERLPLLNSLWRRLRAALRP